MNEVQSGLTNFLKQFEGIDAVIVEGYLFDLAREQVEGYTGGLWNEVQIGNLWIPVLPGSSDDPLHGDKVHVIVATNYANEHTDRVSAGAALAIYVVCAIQNMHFSRRNYTKSDAYADLHHAYRDAVFADDNELDRKAIYRIID